MSARDRRSHDHARARRRRGWRGADARRRRWRARRACSRRSRHRPAGRPRRGRHSRRAGSTGSRAPDRCRTRRARACSARPAQNGAAASADEHAGARRGRRCGSCAWSARCAKAALIPSIRGKRPFGRMASTSEEDEMAGEQLPAGIDLRADRLRDAEDDAAGERAPEIAEAADDHRLEAEDEPRRADRRIEIRCAPPGRRRRSRRRPARAPWRARRCGRCRGPSAARSPRRRRWRGRRGRARVR